VAIALAHRLAGLQGLAGLLVLLAIIYVLLVYFYAWLVSRHHLASACAAGLLLPVGAASFTLRPQIIGYIFFLITLICLERFRQGKQRALWVLPGLFLLWANIHGSFPLGFFVLGLYWLSGLVSFRSGALVAERLDAGRRRHVLWITLLCLLATMLTPYGTRLAAYPLEYMSEQPVNLGLTIEWLPLDFLQPYAQMFLLILLIVLAAQVAAPVTYRLDTMVLVLLMVGESCRHARFLIVFAAVIAPVLATLFARWLPPYQPEKDRPILNAVLMADPSATLPEACSVFVAGNDDAAKNSVVELLSSLGQDDVIDLGGIESARATEMYMPLWLRLMAAFGTPNFSIKVVR
jgi:hypothetical protein